MVLDGPSTEFGGLPVRDYIELADAKFDQFTYRVGGVNIEGGYEGFLKLAENSKINALVISDYGDSYEDEAIARFYSYWVDNAHRIPHLKHLFLGDMIPAGIDPYYFDHGDIAELCSAFPSLEEFRIRGTRFLVLKNVSHPNIKKFIVESARWEPVVEEVGHMDLPNLEFLEYWFGDEGEGEPEAFIQSLDFPKLKHLGIRNSWSADEDVEHLPKLKGYGKLESIDLSLGNLSDVGGEVLLNLEFPPNLKLLNLSHHYLSEEMQEALSTLPFEVILDQALGEVEDEEERLVYYCSETC